MEVTIKSWVEEEGLVFLMERHDGVFYSADYSVSPMYGERFDFYQREMWYRGMCDNKFNSGVDVDLFRPAIYSATGVLLDEGRLLKIVVEDFQKDFILETNGIEKIYYYDSKQPLIKYPST